MVVRRDCCICVLSLSAITLALAVVLLFSGYPAVCCVSLFSVFPSAPLLSLVWFPLCFTCHLSHIPYPIFLMIHLPESSSILLHPALCTTQSWPTISTNTCMTVTIRVVGVENELSTLLAVASEAMSPLFSRPCFQLYLPWTGTLVYRLNYLGYGRAHWFLA